MACVSTEPINHVKHAVLVRKYARKRVLREQKLQFQEA